MIFTHTINKKQPRIPPTYHQPVSQIWVSACGLGSWHWKTTPTRVEWNGQHPEGDFNIHAQGYCWWSFLLALYLSAGHFARVVRFIPFPKPTLRPSRPNLQRSTEPFEGCAAGLRASRSQVQLGNHHIKKENNQTQINIRDCQIAFNIWKIDMVGHHCNNPEFLKYLHQSLDLCSTCPHAMVLHQVCIFPLEPQIQPKQFWTSLKLANGSKNIHGWCLYGDIICLTQVTQCSSQHAKPWGIIQGKYSGCKGQGRASGQYPWT